MSWRTILKTIPLGHRLGAAALIGLAALYGTLALATGHDARSNAPQDLSPGPADVAVDVWQAASLVLDGATVVDVQSEHGFGLAHLPGARRLGEDAATILAETQGNLLIVASKNDAAEALAKTLRAARPDAAIHYLQDGVRPWYLTFELPVCLFAEKDHPIGYHDALDGVKAALLDPSLDRQAAHEALEHLKRLEHNPTLLQSGKPKAKAGQKKKLSGGCG